MQTHVPAAAAAAAAEVVVVVVVLVEDKAAAAVPENFPHAPAAPRCLFPWVNQ